MDETLPPQKPSHPGDPGSAAPAAEPAETREVRWPTRELGRYEVEAKLGEGGMGKVYRCRDPGLERLVAVKVLHEKYGGDPAYRARFLREARTLGGVSHSNVTHVHTVETAADGALLIVMEYVDGESLDSLLTSQGALSPHDALRYVRDVARGLAAAHEKGIVHRDVKPSNILVSSEGAAKIVDFGLAKELTSDASLTDDGIVLGTPQYISPEQGRGHQVDHRSDIYSLGSTLYHLLTGKPPFDETSQIAVIVAHVEKEPTPPHRRREGISLEVTRVVGRMMAVDPGDRYQDYGELVEDLDRVASGLAPLHASDRPGRFSGLPATSRRRIPRQALAAALVALIAVGAILARPLWSPPRMPLPASLQGWYIASPGGTDVLDLDFTSPPADPVAALGEILVRPTPAGPGGSPPRLHAGALTWRDYTRPFGCAQVFDRIDEVGLWISMHKGRFDFAASIIHPDGEGTRELRLRWRPLEEDLDEAVIARRSGEPVPVEPPLPPLPRLSSPYRVLLSLAVVGGSTRLQLRITKPSAAGTDDVARTLYDAEATIPGRDWNRGVLVLHTASARRDFSVSLEKLMVSGRLDGRGRWEVPWRS